MRALGIDFGERRIGLALSDPAGRWALPLEIFERRTDRRAIYRIADLARQEGVGLLVIGEPRSDVPTSRGPAGRRSLWSGVPACRRVRRFGERLARVTGLPVRWVDESLTTVEAGARLAAIGRDHPERRDAVAAQILLQEALDQMAEGGGDEG